MFLNVCGLKSKLRFPDFYDFIMGYNIVLLTETKLDEMDSIEIPGFNIFTKIESLKKENLVVLPCYWITKSIQP